MSQAPYKYHQFATARYGFVSIGRTRIEKVVTFTPMQAKDVISLSFGDLLPDGSIDYLRVSDNGDAIKVLATVVEIVKHFTLLYPEAIILFTGSTVERTRLYGRILRNYYSSFSKSFWVYGAVKVGEVLRPVPFARERSGEYFGFLVKRRKFGG